MPDLIPAVQVTINYRSLLAAGHAPSPTFQVTDGLKQLRVICYTTTIIPITKKHTKQPQFLIDNSHELARQEPFIYLALAFFFFPWG